MNPFGNQPAGNRLRRSIGGLVLGALLPVVYLHLVGIGAVRRVLWAVPPKRVPSSLIVGGLATGWFVVVGDASGGNLDQPRPVPGGHDGTLPSVGDGSITTPGQSAVPGIRIAVAVSLAVLVTVVVHRSHLVVEPDSIVVRAIRETALERDETAGQGRELPLPVDRFPTARGATTLSVRI